jgi:hypothetical protein
MSSDANHLPAAAATVCMASTLETRSRYGRRSVIAV